MSTFVKTIGRLALLLVCLGWFAVMNTADAQEGNAPNETSVVVPTEPTPATPPASTLEPPALPPPMPPAPSQPPMLLAPPTPPQPTERRSFLRPEESSAEANANQFQPGDFGNGYVTHSEEVIPQPLGDIQVRPTPPIKYDTDRGARRMYRDSGAVDVMMLVQNPADGCYYEIPLCIPACCAGEAPSMECDEGIFGRGKVRYCWPCGFEAEIKFRHVLGDVKVDYDA